MEKADGAGRGGRGAESLEGVLARMPLDACHDPDRGAGLPPVEAAEHRPDVLLGEQAASEAGKVEDELRPAVCRIVQTVEGRTADDRAGDIEKVTVTVGPRAEHRVAEHHRVGLAPGDVGARGRPVAGLIGRAGPRCLATEGRIGVHHPPRHAPLRLGKPHMRAAGEIECADIQRRAYRDARTAIDEPLGEQGSRIAVIQRAIDMCGGDRDEMRGAEQPRGLGHDAHRHAGAIPRLAGCDGALVRRQRQAHANSLVMVSDVGRS